MASREARHCSTLGQHAEEICWGNTWRRHVGARRRINGRDKKAGEASGMNRLEQQGEKRAVTAGGATDGRSKLGQEVVVEGQGSRWEEQVRSAGERSRFDEQVGVAEEQSRSAGAKRSLHKQVQGAARTSSWEGQAQRKSKSKGARAE